MSVNLGEDTCSDPKFLVEKLGGFDLHSAGAGGPGGKGLEALNWLKQTIAQVMWCFVAVYPALAPRVVSAVLPSMVLGTGTLDALESGTVKSRGLPRQNTMPPCRNTPLVRIYHV